MQPYVFKNENIPLVDFNILHEAACRHVEELFARKGEVNPTWILATGSTVLWIETPWEDDQEKAYTIQKMKLIMSIMKVHCYCSISEAWIFDSESIPEGEERDFWLNHARKNGLVGIPEKYKDDIVGILAFDKEGSFAHSRYKVTIRRNG